MEFLDVLLMFLLIITAVFLVLLVLVQRGRGGGLAGAFGGMGGQSAFGTKAGDLFTKITIGVATFWILLCLAADKHFAKKSDLVDTGSRQSGPAAPGSKAPVAPMPDSTGSDKSGKTDEAPASSGDGPAIGSGGAEGAKEKESAPPATNGGAAAEKQDAPAEEKK